MTAPTRIGKYEIRHQIGRGAMGVVYEGFDSILERRVAIKTLRLDIFEPSQISGVRARFKREAQSAGQLAHPHIVTVYEYSEHEGVPYIVMEYLAGNELSKILGRGSRLPLSEVVRLMTQLLGALSYAHERKVVHRDVKPGNIFVLDDGSLKVVDFGLAHVEASNLTDTGALLGTPAYMPPEQFLALPVDERSDIFSAGVILYELLTGDKPFTGTVTSIMQKVLRQEPMEPSVLNPTISTAWDTVVKRAMAKKPEARYQSARQFSETIKQVFEKGTINVSVEVTLAGAKGADLGVETLRPGNDRQPESEAQRRVPLKSEGPAIEPARRSSKKAMAFTVTAFVVAIGAVSLYQARQLRDEPGKPGPMLMTAQTEAAKATPAQAASEKSAPAAAPAKSAAPAEAVADMASVGKSARQAKEAAERAAPQKAAEAKKATDKAAPDVREAQVRAAQERQAQDNAAAEKSKFERMQTEKLATEKAATEKMAAARAAAEQDIAVKAKKDGRSAADANGAGDAFFKKEMYAEAVQEYRIAAAMGNASGQSNLGAMYRLGRGVRQDYSEAIHWYRKAGEQNHVAALNSLGDFYRFGWGVSKDYAEAARWYRKSADQNYGVAQSNLGFMYQNGMGVDQDDTQAVQWYRKAANQNTPVGLNNLGVMYEEGRGGLPKDLVEAKRLYRKAAELGQENARRALERLGN